MAEVLSAPVPAITPVKIEGAPEDHSSTTKPESSDREPHQRDQRQGGYRGRGGAPSGRGGFRDGGRGGYQRDGGERRGFGRDGGDHSSRGYNQDRGGRGESGREFDANKSRGASNAAGRGRGGHRGGGNDFWQSTYREGPRGQRQNRDQPEEEKTDQAPVPDEKQKEPKKFTGRCRLFVGNFANDTEEDEMKTLFEKYGECSEIYLNKAKGFGFIRLDTKYNAERAKVELDGTLHKGRVIRVRFATHTAAIRVKNLNPQVSNEVLEEAFSRFGKVERAVVIVDDRGRPTGDGIIEFERKNAAQNAMQKANEGVFLLTSSPCPITVESPVQLDEEDGYPEKSINKNPQYHREREAPPRFAAPGSFEFEFGNRWKQLFEMEKLQKEQLEKSIKDAREKMEAEQDQAWHDHQTMLMRQDLMRRQEELRRMEEARAQEQLRRRELEMRRKEEERLREEERSRRELLIRQQQEEMLRRREMMGGSGGSLRAGQGDSQQMGGGYGPDGLGGMGGGGGSGGSSGMGNVPPRDSLFDAPSGGMGGGMANSPAGMPMSDLSDFGPGGGLGGRDMGPRGSDHRRGNSDHRGEGGAVPLRGPPSLPRLDMRRGHDDYPGDSKRRRY